MNIYLIHSSGLTISTGAVSCWCHLFPTKKGVLQQNYAQKTHASSCQTINQKAKNWKISQSVVLSGCTLWKQICFILSLSNYLKNELVTPRTLRCFSVFLLQHQFSPSFFLLPPFSTFLHNLRSVQEHTIHFFSFQQAEITSGQPFWTAPPGAGWFQLPLLSLGRMKAQYLATVWTR